MSSVNFHIITLFPQMFNSYLGESILARAKADGLIDFHFYNPRDFVTPTDSQKKNDKPYLRVDDKAYGGGPGMVIQAEPILKAAAHALSTIEKRDRTAKLSKPKIKIIFFAPGGKKLDTAYASKVSKKFTDVIFLCGRYEGIDARARKILKAEELSIGDYVLTGGELPAMIVIDTVARQVKGVLGDHASLEESRPSSSDVYTRPEVLEYNGKKHRVPKVLVSGNHKLIEEWREKNRKKE
jgi:tRNA (guanine37-N1)-methyltransferase